MRLADTVADEISSMFITDQCFGGYRRGVFTNLSSGLRAFWSGHHDAFNQANEETQRVMLALINPEALPALRIAGTFFLLINILAFIYIFRNRHRFFGQDPNVTDDIPAVRKLRIEVVLIPWFVLTTLLVILLIYLWSN